MLIIESLSQLISSHISDFKLIGVFLAAGWLWYMIFKYPRYFAWILTKLINGFFISFESPDDARKKEFDELRAAVESIKTQLEKQSDKVDGGVVADNAAVQLEGNTSTQHNTSSGGKVTIVRTAERRRQMASLAINRTPNSRLIDVLLNERLQDEEPPISAEALLNLRGPIAEYETRERQQSDLEKVLSKQLDNATRIRGLMTNLFVVVNFAVIIAILFKADQILANKEIVLGLYISFATFMVYVYRSSNARALILMAGMEDIKRYHDVDKYVQAIGRRGPNDRDIDVLRLLTINRMERERNGEHPYELVLKGISNSNILFKGGKVSATSAQEKEKEKDTEKNKDGKR